ncbi:MAG: DUF177 domain-containing protein [Bacteroidales bacterium]
MKELKDYRIAYQGLELGDHEFEFVINDEFFAAFESKDVERGNIQVSINLEKKETIMQLEISMSGLVEVSCSRCLDKFNRPVFIEEDLIVKQGNETFEESEEVLVLSENEDYLDLAQYFYEYIMLSLPFQVIHPDDEDGESTCDPEILKRLEGVQEEEEKTDPRWDALKKLKK